MIKHIIFALILVSGGYYYWTTLPVTHGPGVVASNAPVQENAFGKKPIEYKGYTLTPKKTYTFQARILSMETYHYDPMAKISPVDIVIGWGPMSDEKVLDQIMVRQSDRSYYIEMSTPPISQQRMYQHSANTHFVPSSMKIRNEMKELKIGHIIKIDGYLVDVKSQEGWTRKTSLKRDDMGDDSGEIVWIKDFTIL